MSKSKSSTPQTKSHVPLNPPDDPYIFPLARCAGEKHILEELDEAGEHPTLKSVGYAKLANGWAPYTITSVGRKVISIEIGEPDMRQITEEQSKIAFVETFQDRDVL